MGGKQIRATDVRYQRVDAAVMGLARGHKLLVVGTQIEIAQTISEALGRVVPVPTVRGHLAAYEREGGNVRTATARHGPFVRLLTAEDVMFFAVELLTPAQRREIGHLDDEPTAQHKPDPCQRHDDTDQDAG